MRHPLPRLATLAAGLTFAACADGSDGKTLVTDSADRLDWTRSAALVAATSCDDAHLALKASAITQMELQLEQSRRCYLDQEGCYYRNGLGEMAPGSDADSPTAPNDDASPDEYSETNTQVEGVDEADLVKTDGERLFGLFGNDFVALDSWPARDTAETGRVQVAGSPHSFYLAGDKAVVLSWVSFYDFLSPEDRADYESGLRDWDYRLWQGGTLITEIDVSGTSPTITSEHMVGGYLLDSRRIDDKLYLAQNDYVWIDGLRYWPDNVTNETPRAEIEAAFDRLHTNNLAVIDALPLEWWLPRRYDLQGGRIDLDDPGIPLTTCANVLVPNVYAGQSLVSVVTYDITNDTFNASTVSGDWGTVYASKDALYVSSTNWGWYGWWENQEEPPPITTQIHRFDLGADGIAHYAASGSVIGYTWDQFAFDEHDGHLRVATTDGFGWWNTNTTTESRVTVLEKQGTRLVETGVVDGLGLGETIQSVRYMGDLGYVVTFRQVDPLYVLDLRDPSQPKVAGELKIPGFSSYIHPIDDGHLLTIGRDATEEGQVGGMKLEIFDLTNPAAPRSVVTKILGDSWSTWSEAQWDHKAFTYFGARGLLGIPVSGWDDSADGYGRYQSELFVFKVGLDSIEQIGAVSHSGLLDDLGVNTSCRQWYGWGDAYVRRAVFIEDYVYSISNLGVVVHDTRDFAAGEVASVLGIDPADFNGGSYYDPCAY